MNRFYEERLPAGYSEAFTVDANDRKTILKLQVAGMILTVVLISVFYFLYAGPKMDEIAAGFSVIKCAVFVASYIAYIVLHELTHGLAYKLLTGKKLTFGFSLSAAYCGVPDIYTYRITSLLSLFAPFTVYTIVFSVLFFIISDPFTRAMILLLMAMHLSGCVGDLYGIGLLLFRFRSPNTLRKDFGPKQVYYTKE